MLYCKLAFISLLRSLYATHIETIGSTPTTLLVCFIIFDYFLPMKLCQITRGAKGVKVHHIIAHMNNGYQNYFYRDH